MNVFALAFAPPRTDEYEAVEGLDQETIELKREYEAQVEKKVASDYVHIMWAYAIVWVLFVGYGVYLWVRARRIEEDVRALQRRLEKS